MKQTRMNRRGRLCPPGYLGLPDYIKKYKLRARAFISYCCARSGVVKRGGHLFIPDVVPPKEILDRYSIDSDKVITKWKMGPADWLKPKQKI